jgi:predicted MFS family arabinose efflux permease
MGYAVGAVIAGATADALGYGGAIAIVAALTAASGLWVLADMPAPRTGRSAADEQIDIGPAEAAVRRIAR